MMFKCVVLTVVFLIVGCVAANAQCPVMPAGYLCISQAAGNAARDNSIALTAATAEIVTLKTSLEDAKRITADVQKTSAENIAKLEGQNTKLLADLSDKSGALGECRGDKVMYVSLIEFLTKNQRSKQSGLLNVRLGGN